MREMDLDTMQRGHLMQAGLYACFLIGSLASVLLGLFIYGYGVYLSSAYDSKIQICSLVPLVGQACVLFAIWSATGVLKSFYAVLCWQWVVISILTVICFARSRKFRARARIERSRDIDV
jgi:hypothetical protein